MAFALKVKNAQRKMSGCPYVKHEDGEALTQEPVVTMENNYKWVSNELEEEIKHVDLKEAADAIGGNYDDRSPEATPSAGSRSDSVGNGGGVIRFKMMNNKYEVRNEGLFKDNQYCQDSWSKIIIYDYVRMKGNISLTGDWVSLGHFPNTASHSKAFQKKAETKIAEKFDSNISGLKERCRELEGVEVQGKIKADYVCGFKILPRVPIYICFCDADEEYPASCKLHVDSSAKAYIDIEYLAYLLEWFVKIFVE
jgi:hypothetical protein